MSTACYHYDSLQFGDDKLGLMTTLEFHCNDTPNTWPMFFDNLVLSMIICYLIYSTTVTLCQNVIWINISHLSPKWFKQCLSRSLPTFCNNSFLLYILMISLYIIIGKISLLQDKTKQLQLTLLLHWFDKCTVKPEVEVRICGYANANIIKSK